MTVDSSERKSRRVYATSCDIGCNCTDNSSQNGVDRLAARAKLRGQGR